RYHETAVQTRLRHEERWQIALAADQFVDAPFTDASHLSDRDREEVQCERQRLSVEVSRTDHQILIIEHGRIVGDRSEFAFHHTFHETDRIARGAVHLRNATE